MHSFRKQLLTALRSPAMILFLLACVFLADLLVAGRTFLLRDGYFIYIKAELFRWQALAHGDFPFWDTQGMGKPFMENLCPGFLYPFSIVFALFSPGMALNLFCLIHLWLVGLGVHFFARQMKLEQWPSLIAAACVMFSTFVMAYLEFPNALAAIPWIFFILGTLARFYHRTISETNSGVLSNLWQQRRLLVALTLFFALCFSTNYLEFLVYPFIGYGLFIVLAAVGERSWRLCLSLSLFFGLAGLLSILLVMPQLGLMLAFLPLTERTGSFDMRFDMASLTAAHLLKAVFPMLGGRPGFPDTYWSPGTYEFCIGTFYTGALALLALPFAFLKPWKERSRTERLLVIWGATLAVFGLLVSFGKNTPVYPLLWKYVPGMNTLRFASKFLLLVIMGQAALIASGVQHILHMPRPITKRVIAMLGIEGALVIAMGILWLLVIRNPALMPEIFGHTGAPIRQHQLAAVLPSLAWSYVFLLLAFGWIVWTLLRGANRATAALALILVFANLLLVSRPVQPAGPIDVYDHVPEIIPRISDSQFRAYSNYWAAHQYLYADPRPDIFKWAMDAGVNAAWFPFPNVNIIFQNGIKLQKYNEWTSGMYASNPQIQNNFMDAAGMRWMAGGEPWPQILWGNADRRLLVAERPTAIPRFALYSMWQPVSSDREAFQYLCAVQNTQLHVSPAIEETSLLRGRETRDALPMPSLSLTRGTVVAASEGNHWIECKLTGDTQQLLVVSDAWYPGWSATIDGNEVPVHRANFMFRGIFIPAGEHTVRLDFWPVNLGIYCAASLAGLLIIIALLVRRRRTTA